MQGANAGRSGSPQRTRVGIRELRGNLNHYLTEASKGALIVVTSRDTVVAEIRAPAAELLPPRQPGAMRGQIWMADDFDDMPPDLLADMES